MAVLGYYRHPTIAGDDVVFVCEDDLWSVARTGGTATRLTANPGTHTRPRFSPDGSRIAFISRDEGRTDVHVMDVGGGPSRRISHFGASSHVVGWEPDGEAVLVASDHLQPFSGWTHLWRVPEDGSAPTPLELGPAWSISHGPDGATVIGRNSFDPARWKRYRGGRAGSLWVDRHGDGEFEQLVALEGNLADPMWIGRRIYFLSDHEGVGNVYSVTPTGRNLQRHTHHQDFYARFASTDGRRIVYHCGGDLWLLEAGADQPERIEVEVPSARPQLNRRFLAPGKYVETVDLHPEGHSLAITARGGAYTLPLWEGAVRRHGPVSRFRQRLAAWLPDGERVVTVSDEHGEETLVVRPATAEGAAEVVDVELGRVRSLEPQPGDGGSVAVTNHRQEVILVDTKKHRAAVVHRSPHAPIGGIAWSPDGRWLAFSAATSRTTGNLFLHDTRSGETHRIGRPEFRDWAPSFDPSGRYLCFLSSRVFDPVRDTVFHDYGFPRSTVPMVIPLTADQPSPFDLAHRPPRAPGGGGAEDDGDRDDEGVVIDVDGLAGRARAFPVQPGRYVKVEAAAGRVYLLVYPITGALGSSWTDSEPPKGTLQCWELGQDKLETVAEGVTGFTLSADRTTLAVRFGRRLRVVPVGWKDDKSGKDASSRETGWIDLSRIRVEVVPQDEWRQMFSEAWRLQRDHYWWEEMGGVDWLEVHDRYLGLIDRVATRSEFSDLLWEMQGELGTSHAYELGGDYWPEPTWSQGQLGADLGWRRGAWRVERIPRGDPWDPKASSPLTEPAVGIEEGDRILAIDGVEVDQTTTPASQLVDKGGRSVTLTVARERRRPRQVVVVPRSSETPLRYRDWVERNRERVRDATDGRAGYIHIPDMGPPGFAEFHRSWLSEVDLDGLVIDVRFNRGGNVSQLLLEKLLRRRIGYRITRWGEPFAFPNDAPAGPMVCLTNEMAGSDGDIFSHTFKLHGLGSLIGTRTWGGVVGIWPRHSLVDGTITTQPEFATWFTDVGYGVENYGTDPDIEIHITPQHYRRGEDPQLDRALAELISEMDRAEPRPRFDPRPDVSPPTLPGG